MARTLGNLLACCPFSPVPPALPPQGAEGQRRENSGGEELPEGEGSSHRLRGIALPETSQREGNIENTQVGGGARDGGGERAQEDAATGCSSGQGLRGGGQGARVDPGKGECCAAEQPLTGPGVPGVGARVEAGALGFLQEALQSANGKLRWNACYALGTFFARDGSVAFASRWGVSKALLDLLLGLVQHDENYKVRPKVVR